MPGHWVWTRPCKALKVLVDRKAPARPPACPHLRTSAPTYARTHARTPAHPHALERERKREERERGKVRVLLDSSLLLDRWLHALASVRPAVDY